MNFLRAPATRRDLLSASAVQTILLCLVIFATLIALIRMQDEQNTLRERLTEARADVAQAETELGEVKADVAAETAQAAQVVTEAAEPVVRRAAARTEALVRTATERVPVPGPARVASVSPRRDTDVAPPRQERDIALPTLPERPQRPVIERPEREREPILPNRPVRAPVAPAPAPPPVVAPPVVAPPIVTPAPPPRPGNKPAHAPCPERNPNCP